MQTYQPSNWFTVLIKQVPAGELRVIAAKLRGESIKAIAKNVGISQKTVNNHATNFIHRFDPPLDQSFAGLAYSLSDYQKLVITARLACINNEALTDERLRHLW